MYKNNLWCKETLRYGDKTYSLTRDEQPGATNEK